MTKQNSNKNYLKLNALKFGLSGGILTGICVFLTTIAAISGYFLVYNGILLDIYGPFGYSFSFSGAIIGAIYGFIDGFIITYLIAALYNKLIS